MGKLNWNDLFIAGSIIDVDVSVWRARLQLKASDLGLDTEDVRKALSLGCHRLAPPETFEALQEITRAVARDVEQSTLLFALIRGARFCPEKNLATLTEKLKAHRERFDEEVNAILASYDSTKAEMLPIIEKALHEAAKTPEDAAKAFQRVQAEYPNADKVRSKFSFRWTVYAISGPASAAMSNLGDEAKNVSDVISGMVTELYTDLREKLTYIINLSTKGGRLQERTIEGIKTLLDRITDLNFVGDANLTQQVNSVRRYLANVSREAVDDTFVKGLTQIQDELSASVEEATKAAETKLTGLGRRKLSA